MPPQIEKDTDRHWKRSRRMHTGDTSMLLLAKHFREDSGKNFIVRVSTQDSRNSRCLATFWMWPRDSTGTGRKDKRERKHCVVREDVPLKGCPFAISSTEFVRFPQLTTRVIMSTRMLLSSFVPRDPWILWIAGRYFFCICACVGLCTLYFCVRAFQLKRTKNEQHKAKE